MSKLKAVAPKKTTPPKPKILLFAKSGVGKTTWALQFPKCFVIDTEGGARLDHYQERLEKAGGVYLGPDQGSLSFDTIIEQVKALGTEKHPYQTLVIDSISKAFNTAISDEADRLKKENKKNEYGADRKPAMAHMRALVHWLMRIDMNVVLVAHQKDEYGVSDQNKAERVVIGETFDCWDRLEYELDLCLHAKKFAGRRQVSVRKSRLVGFPESDTFDLSYEAFAERYGKDVIERETKTLNLASEDQVADVGRLLATVRVDEDFEDKCLKKAQVDSWAEMDSDKIQAVIDSLKQKMVA